MKDGIRGSARRQHAGDCILETPSRDKRARDYALVDEPHGKPATLACDVRLQRIEGRNIIRTHGRDAEHLIGGGHGVCGELTSAGAGSWAGMILDILQLRLGDLASVVRAECLIDVLNGEVTAT